MRSTALFPSSNSPVTVETRLYTVGYVSITNNSGTFTVQSFATLPKSFRSKSTIISNSAWSFSLLFQDDSIFPSLPARSFLSVSFLDRAGLHLPIRQFQISLRRTADNSSVANSDNG
jgi:hypothetical protein